MGRVRVGSNMPEIVEGKHSGGRKRKEGRGLREMRHVLLAQPQTVRQADPPGVQTLRSGLAEHSLFKLVRRQDSLS